MSVQGSSIPLNLLDSNVAERMNAFVRGIQKNTYLNIMVCGSSGIGKTSFIELFLKKFNLKAA